MKKDKSHGGAVLPEEEIYFINPDKKIELNEEREVSEEERELYIEETFRESDYAANDTACD